MFAETLVKPPHFPVPSFMYGLESVAAGLFYLGVTLGVVGAMGMARAAVEGSSNRTLPALLLTGAVTCAILSIIVFIASPRHVLPF